MFSLVLRLSSAGQGPSRTECGCPALSLPLSLTPTLHASGFPKPVQKVRFSVAREIWALIKTATGMQQSALVARLSGAWGPSVCSYQQITSLHFHLMTAYQMSPFAFSASYDSQSPWPFSILKLGCRSMRIKSASRRLQRIIL